MHQGTKSENSKNGRGTLINVTFRNLTKKFKERLEKGSDLCPGTAESLVRSFEKDPSLVVDIKTKVLCYLMLDDNESIRMLGEDALPTLVDAQTIEEFDISKKATKLLLEGLRKYGPKPIEEISGELEEVRKTAGEPFRKNAERTE